MNWEPNIEIIKELVGLLNDYGSIDNSRQKEIYQVQWHI